MGLARLRRAHAPVSRQARARERRECGEEGGQPEHGLPIGWPGCDRFLRDLTPCAVSSKLGLGSIRWEHLDDGAEKAADCSGACHSHCTPEGDTQGSACQRSTAKASGGATKHKEERQRDCYDGDR